MNMNNNNAPKQPYKAEMPGSSFEYMDEINTALSMDTAKGARILLWVVFISIVSVISWMSWAEVDQITRGSGKVVPSSKVQVIQNLEGGIIKSIYVHEGDTVEVNQLLMDLDDIRFSSSVQEVEVDYYSTIATISRLRAEAKNEKIIFPEMLDGFDEYKKREVSLYHRQQESAEADVSIAKKKTTQFKQDLLTVKNKSKHLRTSYELMKRELDMTRPLAMKGIIAQVELLQLEQKVNDLLSGVQENEMEIPKINISIDENEERASNIWLEFREEAGEQLRDSEIKLARIIETRKSLKDQMSRRHVVSPVNGIVQKVHSNTVGGVVKPGMDLIEIVPVDDNMIVETMVLPKDIAFLRVGLPAMIKLTAYDFTIYGGLNGTIENISADTVANEKGEHFYVVSISTDLNDSNNSLSSLAIIPGMTADVDIVMGKRTILSYLLKPILRAKYNALTEL